MTRPWGSCGTLGWQRRWLVQGWQRRWLVGAAFRCGAAGRWVHGLGPRMAGSASGPRPARAAAGARAQARRGCGREPPALARLSCLPRTRRGCWSVPAGVSLAMLGKRRANKKKSASSKCSSASSRTPCRKPSAPSVLRPAAATSFACRCPTSAFKASHDEDRIWQPLPPRLFPGSFRAFQVHLQPFASVYLQLCPPSIRP